jgi:hypothetical protein
MTNETCPFDSAEEKAEWEEMHFSLENEDDAYEEERQRQIDEQSCEHLKAFEDWLSKVNLNSTPDNHCVIGLLRNAFFAGASYGIDQTTKLYRGEGND